jgi:hypothetical protein
MQQKLLSLFLALIFTVNSTCLCFAEALKSSDIPIKVTKSPILLRSRLNNSYQGYELVIENLGTTPIEIINAQTLGGTAGQEGYLMVEKSATAAITGVMVGGGVLALVTFGISLIVSSVASPIIFASNNAANRKARKESLKYTNALPLGLVNVGESTQFATLIPTGQTPQLKITFKDTVTNELHSITR